MDGTPRISCGRPGDCEGRQERAPDRMASVTPATAAGHNLHTGRGPVAPPPPNPKEQLEPQRRSTMERLTNDLFKPLTQTESKCLVGGLPSNYVWTCGTVGHMPDGTPVGGWVKDPYA